MQSTLQKWNTAPFARATTLLILVLLTRATTALALNFNISLSSLTNHNTSAFPAYNENNFGANFSNTTWINQNGATMTIDPTKMDASLNPITPGHVSKTDVHTLIPSRPDLRWFAHATPWFGIVSHINIGLTNNTAAYVAAMVTDMKNRGFNGVVIDWYGQGDVTDGVAQKLKSYLATIPGNTFTYILMVDKGVQGGLGTNNLEAQIQYCQTNYFTGTNYELEPVNTGQPILMFFGVRSVVGASGMTAIKAALGGNMVWVEQGTGYLSESWEDECFEWTDEYDTGVNNSDPFNLNSVTSDYSTIRASGKKAFGAMCSQFNGTLTKSVGWSLGKYLPGSNGLCEVERAIKINSLIPLNMTRMQWPTWSDWEEGTEVEAGIENNFSVTGQTTNTNVLSWTIASGDERTVDHYEIYASTNGVNAAFIGTVPTGTYQTNLRKVALPAGTNYLYIDAVGKPCIRDHLSQPVTFIGSGAPVITQQPTNQTVNYGSAATFNVGVSGITPMTFAWYDQNAVEVGTNQTLTITNATEPDAYFVFVTNPAGTAFSSTAVLRITNAPVTLQTQMTPSGQITLTWPSGTLQSSTNIAGPFTNLAASSPATILPTNSQQFFRIKIP